MEKDPIWFDGQVLKIKRSHYNRWFAMTSFKTDDDFWYFLDAKEKWYREQPNYVQNKWFQDLNQYFIDNIPYYKRPAVKLSDVKKTIREMYGVESA